MRNVALHEAGEFNVSLKEALSEASVDKSRGIIRRVMIGKRESQNPRVYSDQALDDLARLAEGASMYFNHSTESEEEDHGGVRDVRNLAGVYRNARRDGGPAFADLHVFEQFRPFLFAIAEAKPAGVGLSLDSPYGGYTITPGRNGGDDVVDGLSILASIDLVSRAAMAKNLFEAAGSDAGGDARRYLDEAFARIGLGDPIKEDRGDDRTNRDISLVLEGGEITAKPIKEDPEKRAQRRIDKILSGNTQDQIDRDFNRIGLGDPVREDQSDTDKNLDEDLARLGLGDPVRVDTEKRAQRRVDKTVSNNTQDQIDRDFNRIGL